MNGKNLILQVIFLTLLNLHQNPKIHYQLKKKLILLIKQYKKLILIMNKWSKYSKKINN